METMPEIRISLPEDLHEEVQAHPEIDWSEVAQESIRRTINRLHVHEELLEGSRLTEEDAVEIGRDIRWATQERRQR